MCFCLVFQCVVLLISSPALTVSASGNTRSATTTWTAPTTLTRSAAVSLNVHKPKSSVFPFVPLRVLTFFFCGFRPDRRASSTSQHHHWHHRRRRHGAVCSGGGVLRVSARPLSSDERRRRNGHQRLRGPRAVLCAARIRAAPELAIQLAAR